MADPVLGELVTVGGVIVSSPISGSEKMPETSGSRRIQFWPQTTTGWWALILFVGALLSWIILPQITMTYREIYPVTDTWVMPTIAVLLTDAAAILGLFAIWRKHERSIANITALCLMITAALFVTWMLVGEGLAGV